MAQFNLTASSVQIEPDNVYGVKVQMETRDFGPMVENLTTGEILEHREKDYFLDEIGVEYIKKYFDLVENKDQ